LPMNLSVPISTGFARYIECHILNSEMISDNITAKEYTCMQLVHGNGFRTHFYLELEIILPASLKFCCPHCQCKNFSKSS